MSYDIVIEIGGHIPDAAVGEALVRAIAKAELGHDYDEGFEHPSEIVDMIDGSGPLTLFAGDASWGRMDDLKAFCVANDLPFRLENGPSGEEGMDERIAWTPGMEVPAVIGIRNDKPTLSLTDLGEALAPGGIGAQALYDKIATQSLEGIQLKLTADPQVIAKMRAVDYNAPPIVTAKPRP